MANKRRGFPCTIRSRVTNKVPGLTKGKRYKLLGIYWWDGTYFQIVNNRKELMCIYEPEKYLHTEDIRGPHEI